MPNLGLEPSGLLWENLSSQKSSDLCHRLPQLKQFPLNAFFFLVPNYFVHQPSLRCSFSSLSLIREDFAFLPALVSLLLLDLDIISFTLTSPLGRLIARYHGASTDLSLACPLNDCYVLAPKIFIMKSLQLLDQGVSSDIFNMESLQLMDQVIFSVIPSFYYGFFQHSNADFKCSVKPSSQRPYSFTYGLCNEPVEVLPSDLPVYHFQDTKHYLPSETCNSVPCLSVLLLSSMDSLVKRFSAGNILIAIINNCAISLHSSASAPRNLHNQGVENAIQHCFYCSVMLHFVLDTQSPVNVRYFFLSGTFSNLSQADYTLPRCIFGHLQSKNFLYTSSVDVIHPVVSPSQTPLPSRPLVSVVVNSSTDKTLALIEFLSTWILTNVHFGIIVFNLIRHWNILSLQCKVFSKTSGLLIRTNSNPDFHEDYPTTSVSSFILAALASSQLGFPQDDQTSIYEDNESAFETVNRNKPTKRSQHIDIQFFARLLGRVLNSRRGRCIMGHYQYPSSNG